MNNLIRSGDRSLGWGFLGDVDNILNGFLRAPMTSSLNTSVHFPAIDISETDSAYLVKADMPGMRKQDFDITVSDGVLTINAEHAEETNEKDNGRLIRQERSYGKFSRSLRIGSDVDDKKVTAKYQEGILNLTLPKEAKAQARQVQVAVS
jgi:HSP20 family protein